MVSPKEQMKPLRGEVTRLAGTAWLCTKGTKAEAHVPTPARTTEAQLDSQGDAAGERVWKLRVTNIDGGLS